MNWRKIDYSCGITVDFSFNSINTDAFKIKGFSVNYTLNKEELVVKANGVWLFFETRNLLKQALGFTNKIEQ